MTAFKKGPPGAPERLSQEIIDKVVNAMRAGAYIETAAVVSGITKQTLYTWLKKGNKEPDTIYGRFLDAVNKGMEECVMRDLYNIDQAAMGRDPELLYDDDGKLVLDGQGHPIFKKMPLKPDWSASAWRLERRHAKYWSKTEKQEVNLVDKASTMTEEEIEAEIDRLRKLRSDE